jgi:hypothetical protein
VQHRTEASPERTEDQRAHWQATLLRQAPAAQSRLEIFDEGRGDGGGEFLHDTLTGELRQRPAQCVVDCDHHTRGRSVKLFEADHSACAEPRASAAVAAVTNDLSSPNGIIEADVPFAAEQSVDGSERGTYLAAQTISRHFDQSRAGNACSNQIGIADGIPHRTLLAESE